MLADSLSAMRRFLCWGLPLVLLLLAPPLSTAQEAQYGETTFENSGAEAAQAPFLRGLLLLHSFEYGDARRAFREAQRRDPDFAMAHWGEAMTHNHPIWMEQDRAAALETLQDFAPSPKKRLEKTPTEREAAYLRTLHVLYGAGDEDPRPKERRDDAYADALADLAAKYPDDLDAQAFHALALLGTAHEGRDFATYMRAAGIVEEVFDENPRHPGAAHYLIHAYDDPVHAPLGLRPARVYADIAPAAPHALHMPSHIFFAMGMWDRGAASNVDSYEAARAKSRERDQGLSGGGFHALHWLHYARLQQGRHDEARAVLDTTRRHARRAASGYADYMRWYMPAAHVMGTEEWGELDPLLDAMAVNVDSLDARGAVTVHAGRGLAAAQRGDRAAAEAALSRARTALGNSDAPDLRIQVLELSGLLALTRGETAPALDSLRAAAALEAEQPLEFGPPFPVKPAHELYGEALLRLDRPAEALPQFEETLARYPDRALALRGTAEAAARAGKPAVAREARAALEAQWREADAALQDRLRSLTRSSATDAAESR